MLSEDVDGGLSAKSAQEISIIIPLGPTESTPLELLNYIDAHLATAEVLVVGSEARPSDLPDSIPFLKSPPGRAPQLNTGARKAGRPFLWFLHADTDLDGSCIQKAFSDFSLQKNHLYYMFLEFCDGPRILKLNQWGANLRSLLLDLPYGDQGLLIDSQTFFKLGGFDENQKLGEDFYFVRRAKQKGVKIKPLLGAKKLKTSGRKYQQNGWFKTTARHFVFTLKHYGRAS